MKLQVNHVWTGVRIPTPPRKFRHLLLTRRISTVKRIGIAISSHVESVPQMVVPAYPYLGGVSGFDSVGVCVAESLAANNRQINSNDSTTAQSCCVIRQCRGTKSPVFLGKNN